MIDYEKSLLIYRPLKREVWSQMLINHLNCYYVNIILDITKFGAKIGFQEPPQQILSKNLSFATDTTDTFLKILIIRSSITGSQMLIFFYPSLSYLFQGLFLNPIEVGNISITCHILRAHQLTAISQKNLVYWSILYLMI